MAPNASDRPISSIFVPGAPYCVNCSIFRMAPMVGKPCLYPNWFTPVIICVDPVSLLVIKSDHIAYAICVKNIGL